MGEAQRIAIVLVSPSNQSRNFHQVLILLMLVLGGGISLGLSYPASGEEARDPRVSQTAAEGRRKLPQRALDRTTQGLCNWTITCFLGAGNPGWGLLSASLIGGGLLVTLLGAGYVRALVRRSAERRDAAEALRRSQADLSHAQAVAHIGSWRSDLRGQQVQWSEETYRIFGLPCGTPVNQEKFLAAVHPDDRETVDRSWQAALKGAPYDIEYRIRAGDTVKWVRAKAELEFDPRGDLLGGFGTMQDVTERKRAEQALHESEQRFHNLFDCSPDAIFVEDLNGRVLNANPAACRLHGLTREALIGKPASELVPPEHRPSLPEDFGRLVTGEVHELEGFSWTADGRSVPVELRVSRIVYSGQPALLLNARDITERKQAEAVARRERERLRRMVDTAQVGILFASLDGKVHEANDALLRMIGWTREEFTVRSLNWRALTPPEFGELGREELDQLLRHGATRPAEWIILHKNGRRIPVLCNRVLLPGAIEPEFVALLLDLTGQRQLEGALQDSVEATQSRIARDLHDGLGQQLGGALYLSRMVHVDLQNRGAPETSRAAEVSRLLKEALELTRRVAHGLHSVPVESDGLMLALEALTAQVSAANRVETVFECEPPVLIADARLSTHLFRIAQEAVNNALKHSQATHIEIALWQDAETICLRVRDNGVGLAYGPRGHGLGMQTMKHRAQLIGGILSVQNATGGGVIVNCQVPLVAVAPVEPLAAIGEETQSA
jgi:PAS domain S-box-containing protein